MPSIAVRTCAILSTHLRSARPDNFEMTRHSLNWSRRSSCMTSIISWILLRLDRIRQLCPLDMLLLSSTYQPTRCLC
ncbi:hypothetical protein IQ07DRAFT_430142 [Pyrenochaeta sp. DS3sAY3a]|nr:hypothetical protein IQ07DRAFT_430142 [Pyrenochaeta sp. DS3sAY3a]